MAEPYTMPQDFNAPIPQVDQPPIMAGEDDAGKKDLKMVLDWLSEGRRHRSKWDKDWPKQQDYYDGKQWTNQKVPKYRSQPVANIVRPSVETIIPILTDTSPGFDVTAAEPTDFAFADLISKTCRGWWLRNQMAWILVEGLYDACIKDVGYLKVVWDTDAQEGLGDVKVSGIAPDDLFFPEGAEDFRRKCPWVIELYPATVGEAKRRWPAKAEKIRPASKGENSNDGEKKDPQVYLTSPVDKQPTIKSNAPGWGSEEESKTVWIAECWCDDYSEEEYDLEQTDDQGNVVGTEKQMRRKYPRGKTIWIIPELQLHLETAENPYRDGHKPYVRLISTLVPRNMIGCGDVKPLMEVQDMVNRTLQQIYDWMRLTTNPVWVVDVESGVDPGKITNQIGAIIPKRQGTQVQRMDAPAISGQVFELYRMLRDLGDTQSGVHDITQGRKPTGITAAQAISEMQEAAQTRIRLKERNMSVSLQQLGELIVSRFLQFYTAPRFIKVTGSRAVPQYIEWFMESNEETGNIKPRRRVYDFNEDTGEYIPATDWEELPESKGIFDIEVVAGTALPFMKERRGQLALSLFERKAIDQEALLKALEWPEKEQTMERMKQQTALAAQQAAQAQAAGQPPPGTPPQQPGPMG